MKDPNCIFCKIVSKEVPSNIVFEDEDSIAFLDIHPKAPRHTLLIPKDHYPWFIDMPENLSDKIFKNARQLAIELKVKHQADYVRLGIVGTDVPHTHLHLIPLKLKDKPQDIEAV